MAIQTQVTSVTDKNISHVDSHHRLQFIDTAQCVSVWLWCLSTCIWSGRWALIYSDLLLLLLRTTKHYQCELWVWYTHATIELVTNSLAVYFCYQKEKMKKKRIVHNLRLDAHSVRTCNAMQMLYFVYLFVTLWNKSQLFRRLILSCDSWIQ